MAEWGEYAIDSATQPIRARAHQEAFQQAQNTPVVGELMQASNTAHMFKKLFGKKKNPDE